MDDWLIFNGLGVPHDGIERLPAPPPWRTFHGGPALGVDRDAAFPTGRRRLGSAASYRITGDAVELINTALYLRRPLLVTGQPGTGKSTLAYAVAHELRLGPVLRWPITSKSALHDGLYRYDAISRVEDANLSRYAVTEADGTVQLPPLADLGQYLRLGPLGTALAPFEIPRVVLVDEVDKGDIDLPNDLLDVFEEGEYEIPELSRIADRVATVHVRPADDGDPIPVEKGRIACRAFPFVVMTSNNEREFPPAFLRRCVRLNLEPPDLEQLKFIVETHLGAEAARHSTDLIDQFLRRRDQTTLATDQLLNAIYLRRKALGESSLSHQQLVRLVLHELSQLD